MAKHFSAFSTHEVSALSKEEAASYLGKMSVDEINSLPETFIKALPDGTGELLKKTAIDVGELKLRTAMGFWQNRNDLPPVLP